jgi:D-arabinose 1-dehydrogenase-like Zn-dependent alcohol dehydrogenase
MKAMVLEQPRQLLREIDLPIPKPGLGQVLLKIHACAVCRTDLHVVDGELPNPKLPLVLGHEIVGTVIAVGDAAHAFAKQSLSARIGSASRVVNVSSAALAVKTCANAPSFTATRSTADTQNT